MPSSLRLARVQFSFGDQRLLLDATLALGPGWTGVVGPNGAGKTTLLRLLTGELAPDAGHVARAPAGLRVHLCPQRVEHLEPEIQAFAASPSPSACLWRGRLALEPTALARWSTLSPGERKRWQIGAALAEDPGALLLDEPSNHLDAQARAALVSALAAYEGIGVVVSHDRALLDTLTRATIRLEGGAIDLFPGPYGEARLAWEQARAAELARWGRAHAEERRARRQLAEARRARAEADAARSTGRRMKGARDHDARSVGAKLRVEWAESGLGRQVGAAASRLARAEEEAGAARVHGTLGRELHFEGARAPRRQLVTLRAAALRAGGTVLLAELELALERGGRAWIRGPNGVGKSTLLGALLAAAQLPPDRVLHLPQELSEAEEERLLSEARSLDPAARGRLMQIVAALGVAPERLVASARPSPGEARKLAIALGLAREVWLLALDEPTNHLDLPSVERLEAALAAFPGAILLVTHDPRFGAALGGERWTLGEGRVRVEGPAEKDNGQALTRAGGARGKG